MKYSEPKGFSFQIIERLNFYKIVIIWFKQIVFGSSVWLSAAEKSRSRTTVSRAEESVT